MPDLKPRKISFESRDGFILQGEWHSAATDKKVINPAAIISPGMGIPARFYLPFTRHLVKYGIDVLLFD
jgi:predicted alpha/beta hydrolase